MSIFAELVDWVHHLIDGTDAHPHDISDLGLGVRDAGHHVADAHGAMDAFPNPSGDSVLDQVNASIDKAGAAYHQGMDIANNAPHMASAGQQAQGIIDGVTHASPDQLAHMHDELGGMTSADEIHNSVAESQANLSAGNAAHEAIRSADQGLAEAQGVEAGAEAATDG